MFRYTVTGVEVIALVVIPALTGSGIVLLTTWAIGALHRDLDPKACTHPHTDTSWTTQVTRCLECGDIIER